MKKNTRILHPGKLRVAIVHDYFREYGGAERVAEELVNIFPQSVIHTALVNPNNLKVHWHRMKNWKFNISWYGKIPFIRNYPSLFRFLAPLIWESFDFSNYDVVISSSGWFMCKGVITRPETLHISYVHHQNKFLTYYETPDDWKNNKLKRIYAYIIATPLRMWDFIGSQRPDILVSNSEETRKRIQKYYRRDALVIYPPIYNPFIDIEEKLKKTQDYFITVSRLSAPKHIEVLVKLANETGIRLFVVGKGKEYEVLKKYAKSNVVFTGEITDEEMSVLQLSARAFLSAAVDEDFGMAPVEAMMYGVPVIAYKSGGLKETVVNNKTGFLVPELTSASFREALMRFEKTPYEKLSRSTYRAAQSYSSEYFREKMLQLVNKNLKK